MAARIVVIGSANTDLVARVPSFPAPGESKMADEFHITPGGKGANQAVAAVRAGADVTFVGRLGDDDFGRRRLDELRCAGVDCTYVRLTHNTHSGVALIAIEPSGENLIVVAPGANMCVSERDVTEARNALAGADCLLLQLEIPHETVYHALRVARKEGVTTILNPAPAPSEPLPDDVWPHIDYLTPNQTEMAALTSDLNAPDAESAARALLARGVGAVIMTLGAHGAHCLTPDMDEVVPAFEVEAVDTVGAGDAFAAGLGCALAEGRPLLEAVRFANAAAALSVTGSGAQESMPERHEIEELLAS